MKEVLAGRLWTGNAFEARDVRRVLDLGVTAVVDLAIEEPPILFPRDIVYCRLSLMDGSDNISELVALAIGTVVKLVNCNFPTLAACSGGMSRSPAIAAAAIARLDNISLEVAMLRIAAMGPCDVSPGLWRVIHSVQSDSSR
jgi:protein-tyrosine phosphatase